MTYGEAKALLEEKGQAHVLEGFYSLSEEEQKQLLNQIEGVDFSAIEAARNHVKPERGNITPMGAMELWEIEENKARFEETGKRALREGKVAALLLAGGMGTRLGSDKPKGMTRVGIEKDFSIFECLIKNLLAVTEPLQAYAPLYIMTSEKNDEETRRFFREKNYFGYPEREVTFFRQDMAAAVDFDGKLLKEAPGRLATSPNGNGGWFLSMKKAGLLPDLHRRGVEWINLFAVDNVLQKICDPAFVGATLLSGADCSGKVIPKAEPEEKLGVLCLENGHPSIVEYYEMTEDMRTLRDKKGDLLYRFGVILNYMFRLEKLEEIASVKLPLHIVEKKIPYIDGSGKLISPEEPNGYKFESLVLDMIMMMDEVIAYEVVREKEFAPIKNLHGADSLDSARELLKLNGVEL